MNLTFLQRAVHKLNYAGIKGKDAVMPDLQKMSR